MEIIKLGSQPIDRSISAQLKRQKQIRSTPLRILTSPKTTLGLATILGTLIAGPAVLLRGAGSLARGAVGTVGKSFVTSPIRTSIGLASLPVAIGVASTPEARRFVAGGFQRGRDLPTRIKQFGSDVEDFIRPDTGTSIIPPILAGAGIGAGVAALAPPVIGAIRSRGQLPTLPSGQFQPLAPVRQPVEAPPEPLEVKMAPSKPVKITNTFTPNIDIRFSKSKKFINQQVLFK